MATVTENQVQDAAASVDTTYTISAGDGFEGSLEGRSDEDWVKVRLVAGTSYDITLQGRGLDGVADTILTIFNAAGEEVAHNDDVDFEGAQFDSMVKFTPDVTGIYYLSARGYPYAQFDDTSGGYRLTVASGAQDNNPDTPYTILLDEPYTFAAGQRFLGTLDSNADRDWIRVDLVAGKTYVITLNGIGADADMDTVLRIHDSFGEQVAINDDVDHAAGRTDSMLTFSPEKTGTYFISAGAYQGNPNQDHSGRYQVTLYDKDAGGQSFASPDNIGIVNRLRGGPDTDELLGGSGYDWLEGGAGADLIRGGDNHDTAIYTFSDAGVEVRLDDGTAKGGHAEGDTFPGVSTLDYLDSDGVLQTARVSDIERLYGSAHDDILIGDQNANTLLGYHGDDELDGRGGRDWLFGGAGADVLKGGADVDMVSYSLSDDAVVVRLHDGTAQGGHAEGDTFPGKALLEYFDGDGNLLTLAISDIEQLQGSDFDDVLAGDAGDNWIDGHLGDDLLDGREGRDILEGERGADVLIGGPGIDAAYYLFSDAGVEVRLYDGTARGGHAEGDTFAGTGIFEYRGAGGATLTQEVFDIENLHGSRYDDILAGDIRDNELEGGSGDDELDGREGDDLLIGGAGADSLTGGAGVDTVSYLDSLAGVVVRLHSSLAMGGHAEGDIFAGTEIIEVTGPGGATLTTEVPDIENLVGSSYDDILAGDLRDNLLDGGAGNDTLYGGPDGGADVLLGQTGDDRLYGGKGDDMLAGGPGGDWLSGGADNDSLQGGAGPDVFVFAPGGGDDAILDFGLGEDRVDLTAFADIQSLEDLILRQQGNALVIDLSGQDGGMITLADFNEADLMDAHFIFFPEAMSEMA